jgi:hypothetical protein
MSLPRLRVFDVAAHQLWPLRRYCKEKLIRVIIDRYIAASATGNLPAFLATELSCAPLPRCNIFDR